MTLTATNKKDTDSQAAPAKTSVASKLFFILTVKNK